MKRIYMLILAVLLVILSACGNDTNGNSEKEKGNAKTETSGKATEISILLGKPEIAVQFDEMLAEFQESNKDIKITVIPLAGQNAYEKMTTLYSSKNAPTIMMMGSEFDEFKDRLVDLSDQPWVDHAFAGTLDFVQDEDKILGMPVTVEAFGYIYNKEVMEITLGEAFDPTSINTIDSFKIVLDEISSQDGKAGIHVSPMDWSLGAHFTNIFFSAQSSDRDERHQFMQDLKDGKVDLASNKVFNGWLDSFDLMKENNQNKKAPLAPQYDDGPLALSGGDVGTWFMGNWAYPQLVELEPEGEYGFISVPISNNPEDYGNNEISIGVPSYWAIDASQSKPEEQEAAKKLLNWLVSDEVGQDYYVNKLNLIPIFDNFKIQPEDSLSQQIVSYMEENKALEWMNTYYPADGWPTMGASMQKYLSGVIDRAELTKEFEDYWKSAK